MPMRYYLQPNAIATDPNDFKARILPTESLDHEAIVNEMLKTGSTITEADIHAVMTTFYNVVAHKVAEGNNVNLPIANFRTSISGIFYGANDQFDAERHTAKAKVVPGKLLRQMVAGAELEKTKRVGPQPQLLAYTDINSSLINSTVTPQGIGVLTGGCLDFNPSNGVEGLFFKHTNGNEFKVIHFSQRMNKKLVFLIPSLPSGEYQLEVRKDFGTTRSLLRKSQLPHTLFVI